MTYYWTYITASDDCAYCGSTDNLDLARRMAEKVVTRLEKAGEWYRVQIMGLEGAVSAAELAARLNDETDKLHNAAQVCETWQG